MRSLLALLAVVTFIAVTGCSSKETSADAREKLDKKWEPQVGKATKAEFVEAFGNPEWCKAGDGGEETCRFYNKKGVKWMGDKRDRKSVVSYDEAVVEFDPSGRLREFKNTSQR